MKKIINFFKFLLKRIMNGRCFHCGSWRRVRMFIEEPRFTWWYQCMYCKNKSYT